MELVTAMKQPDPTEWRHPCWRCCIWGARAAASRPPLRLASAETALGTLFSGPCTGMSATHAACRNTDLFAALSDAAARPLLFSLSELFVGERERDVQ